jgi:hypothetical protein
MPERPLRFLRPRGLDQFVVAVGGDLSRTELVRVAGSLHGR